MNEETKRQSLLEKEDERFMREAIKLAKRAAALGEVPIGAVVVMNGKIIARGKNERILKSDATAHAEVVAIKKAGQALKRWNLTDAVLYVTLEPCIMCAGAVINSRISRVVFGAFDERFGCLGSKENFSDSKSFNHSFSVKGGVLLEECSSLLKEFFKTLRNEKTVNKNNNI